MIFTFKCNLTNSTEQRLREKSVRTKEREWAMVKTLKVKLNVLWSLCNGIFSVTLWFSTERYISKRCNQYT